MNTFQEYPKVLRHPAEAPAVVSVWNEQEKRYIPEHGSPAKFQPVTVNNFDQEEEYLAKGYRAPDSDPAAYEQAVSSPLPPGYAYAEYPKWIGEQLVHSREEEDVLLGKRSDPFPPPASKSQVKRMSYKERNQPTPVDQVAA